MKAFPAQGYNDGMDLRDYFASQATEQDIQQHQWEVQRNTGHLVIKQQVRTREEARYSYADSMLKARKL